MRLKGFNLRRVLVEGKPWGTGQTREKVKGGVTSFILLNGTYRPTIVGGGKEEGGSVIILAGETGARAAQKDSYN